MSETAQKGTLTLQQLIATSSSQICISVKTGQLSDFSEVPCEPDPIKLSQFIGGSELSKYLLWKKMPLFERRQRPNKIGFEMVKVGETFGYESVSRQLSVVFKVSKEEIENLLHPLYSRGMTKCYVYLKSQALGINETDFFESKFGIKNVWLASGSIPLIDYKFCNSWLKSHKSDWRVRTEFLFVSKVLAE
jgi:hypothetical protein